MTIQGTGLSSFLFTLYFLVPHDDPLGSKRIALQKSKALFLLKALVLTRSVCII